MTPEEAANRELVAKFWHYTATGQQDKIIELVTDDCMFKVGVGKSERAVPYHGTYRGVEQIKEYLEKARRGRLRTECSVNPVVPGEVPKPMKEEPSPLGLLAHGDTVVGIGEIVDLFPDHTPMHKSEIAVVVRVDQNAQKISSFQLFLDTAAPMLAHLHR